MNLRAKYIRYLFFVLAILFALPLPISKFTGLTLWISPYMLLISLFALKSVVFFNVLGFIASVFMFFRKRWICRYVCPLGVICDLTSKVQMNKDTIKLNLNKYLAITSIVLAAFLTPVLVILDPFNIFHMSFEGFRTGFQFSAYLKIIPLGGIIVLNILLPNIWCRSLCPLGGMQLLAFDLGKASRKSRWTKKSISADRRSFIAGLAGILAGVALPSFNIFSPGKYIRPPGAMEDPDMNLVCARCGNCSSACPTQIIKSSGDTRMFGSLLTPVIDFSESYCLPECTLCGDVCPSGAINTFVREEKKDLYMASVHIDLDNCWLQNQRDCDLCRFHCAYNAIEIRRTEISTIALPILNEKKCIGCAACKIVCPPQAISII